MDHESCSTAGWRTVGSNKLLPDVSFGGVYDMCAGVDGLCAPLPDALNVA